MKAIDLFCCAGGTSTGLEQAGIEVVLAVDHHDLRCQAYEKNHPETEVWNEDIIKLDPAKLPKADLICGSIPCQSFSKSNQHTRTFDMSLTNCFLHILARYKPRYWICENIREAIPFFPAPWNNFVHMLNAMDYGAPQMRTRMIAGNYLLPRVTHTSTAMHTLDGLATERFRYISDVMPYLKHLWLCDQRTTKPTPTHTACFFHCDRPSRAVTSKQFAIVARPEYGIKKQRYLTADEHALIQGFPHGYLFTGPKYEQQFQVANAVSPAVAKAVGLAILAKDKQHGGF